MIEVSPDELKAAVESQHGGTATLVQSVLIVERPQGEIIWSGVIHAFDLAGHPKAKRAYAWANEDDEGKRRIYTALHMGPIKKPMDAVRAAIVAEQKDRRGESDLEMVERHVRIGRYQIARQQQNIKDLERGGHDASVARDLLKVLEVTQASHLEHLARLLSN